MRFWFVILLVAALVLLLKTQFPYALNRPDQITQVLYLGLFIALIASGSGLMRRVTLTQAARDAMVWVAIILVLVLGYSFRGEWRYSRIMTALIPSRIHKTDDGGLSIEMAQDGHFHMEVEINGVPVDFLVDTGASDIVLSPEDAVSAGYQPETLNYTKIYSTANGTGSGAPVSIATMVVGPYTLNNVPASVNSAAMDMSLLGMSFLKQFREYRVTGDTLTLYP